MTTAHRSGVSSTNRRALAYIDVSKAVEIARTGSIDFSSIRHIGVTSGAGMSSSVANTLASRSISEPSLSRGEHVVQQALYVFGSRSNRAAREDTCSITRCSACPSPTCPLPDQQAKDRTGSSSDLKN